jgi:hypothetical protein
MAQLHLYLPENLADLLKKKAKARQQSVSKFLSNIVKKELKDQWPNDFFHKVVGGWKGNPLERPDQGELENREKW